MQWFQIFIFVCVGVASGSMWVWVFATLGVACSAVLIVGWIRKNREYQEAQRTHEY